MYINPFWGGVLLTLMTELVGFLILCYIIGSKEEQDGD